MTFTKDFFGDNGKNWIQWLKDYIGRENLHFLEIGCFEGRATVWLLKNILTHESSGITVIDTFEGSVEHRQMDTSGMYENFIENIAPYREKVTILKGYSQVLLRKFTPDSFDFIYVDGSHQAQDVLEDAVLSWPLVKRGGVIIFDDYSWGDDKYKDDLMKPRIAIDAFLTIFKGRYYLVAKERQVCLIRL